jgi:hypothetical protein
MGRDLANHLVAKPLTRVSTEHGFLGNPVDVQVHVVAPLAGRVGEEEDL